MFGVWSVDGVATSVRSGGAVGGGEAGFRDEGSTKKTFQREKKKLTPTHTILESNNIKHKTTNQPHSLVRNTNFSDTAD